MRRRLLAEGITTPLASNVAVTSFADIPRSVQLDAVQIILCDHHYWGGITGCQTLGTIARSLGWVLSQHSNSHTGVSMAAMIHLAALVPELTVASDTHYPWLVDSAEIIDGGKLPMAGGKMKVPAGAGLGVELDRDRLARAHEVYQKCSMRDRDDVTTMRMVEPGWQRTIY